MKFTFLIIATLFVAQLFSQSSTSSNSVFQKLDSVKHWQINANPFQFIGDANFKHVNYSYDNNNNFLGATTVYRNANFDTVGRVIYTYNLSNKITSLHSQTYSLGLWINGVKDNYTYDINNNETSKIRTQWNTTGLVWENVKMDTSIYNVNNKRITLLTKNWIGGVWVNQNKQSSSYNINNYFTIGLGYRWNVNTNSWDLKSRGTNYYDINNNVDSILSENWTSNNYVNASLEIYTYDTNNNKTSWTSQGWNQTAWQNSTQYVYTYDSSNNLITQLNKTWNITNNQWKNTGKSHSYFDSNNFITYEVGDSYKSDGITIDSRDSVVYYFHAVVGVKELKSNNKNISIYPNPSKGIFNINSSNTINSIEVYNIIGTLISKPELSLNNQIDLSSLSKGMYFLKVFDSIQYHTEKIIIE